MKFKYALLVAVGLAFSSSYAFAEPEISPERIEALKQKANQGDVKAQETLGELYQTGLYGVEKDLFEARDWFEKAVQQGETSAMVNLGSMYLNGDGVPQDYLKAKELFEKAANKGKLSAQHNLGGMYYFGKGIPKNYTKAIEWYQKAANQGDGNSYNNLAFMYEHGEGVPQDIVKAKEYYKQACLHKSTTGCNNYKKLNNP